MEDPKFSSLPFVFNVLVNTLHQNLSEWGIYFHQTLPAMHSIPCFTYAHTTTLLVLYCEGNPIEIITKIQFTHQNKETALQRLIPYVKIDPSYAPLWIP